MTHAAFPSGGPRTSRLLRAAAALTASAALLLACGTDDGGSAVPEPAPTSSAEATSSSSVSSTPASAAPTCGAETLDRLSQREKLAQLLVVGVTGTADARSIVAAEQIGGVFIGSWTDLSILSSGAIKEIAEDSNTPLMVTVDQEGGRVSRLSSLGIDTPSARQMAQTQTPDQVRATAREIGEKMRELGITVDFAPVADVGSRADGEVIGDRAFSSDPAVVTEYASAFADGLREAGILPVYKHFPGHGAATGDSHLGSVATPPLAELRERDLVPYRTLLRQRGVAVMVGHMAVPGLTDEPSTLSQAVMHMLRTGRGYDGPPFNGVVFSDDLSGMAAITDHFTIQQAALRFIQAGGDVALWLSTDQVPAVLDTLEQAVADGDLPAEHVDRKVTRVLRAKGVLDC